MDVRQRLAEVVLGKNFIDEIKQQVVRETVVSGKKEDDTGWRPITGAAERDLSPLTQGRMQEIAFHLYDRNPVAHRILEMTKDFVVGEGISFTGENDKVEKVLKDFWDDPVNAWDLKQGQRVLELGLYGEQFYPAAVNEIDGRVRMGYLDPSAVAKVVQDPENVEIIRQVKRKGSITTVQKTYNVVNVDEDVKSPTYWELKGELFFFAINKVASALRGRSDLFCLADWIDGYDQFLFNRLERSHLMNVFLWDITLEGYNQNQVEEWLKNQGIPKPASMRAHNEKVKWNAVVPELGAHDASEEAKLFRNMILGGAGLPPHWFAGGEGITRATALEMSTPVMKRLKTRQKYFKYMIDLIFKFVIAQAIIHKKLTPRDIDRSFAVGLPKLLEKDIYTLSRGLKFIIGALETGMERKWIDEKDAKKIFAYMMSQLGLEIKAREGKGK